ncbi:Serine--tRNA ligase [Nitratireductor aquimarinus]|uniref:serine--tRNA ligase n=1 Tax=Nitratireductor aquimarinus TaxID=889300 RepID=UPI003B5A2091
MLDIKWIRENPQALDEALKKRGADPESGKLLALDEARRQHLTKLQEAQERRNAASKEIGKAMASGDKDLAEKLKAEVSELKSFVQDGEAEERRHDAALNDALARVPNIPLEDVPVGADENDNVEVRRHGEPKHANWSKEHFEIGEALGLMDFERAAKLSGSRFTVLSGQLARLERALGQFMLDLHTQEHGYTEVQPPLLVRDDAMFGTGQLPKFTEDLFSSISTVEVVELFERYIDDNKDSLATFDDDIDSSDRLIKYVANLSRDKAVDILKKAAENASRRWLIPTAEVPLTNLVREEILEGEKLPLRFTALTPCFRSEAGSAGRDTRGMLRQHQFYKVELVSITDAESAIDEHERMTACAETVLKKLDLPYRTMVLCTGDMGFGARKTYDLEVWLPGQNAYREISSCSVCGDFQGRRMNARYRASGEKQTRFVHTLNGSGTAVGRALIAVLENYQNEDGSVTIPSALKPYMGGLEKIEASKD